MRNTPRSPRPTWADAWRLLTETVEGGVSVRALAQEVGVPHTNLARWLTRDEPGRAPYEREQLDAVCRWAAGTVAKAPAAPRAGTADALDIAPRADLDLASYRRGLLAAAARMSETVAEIIRSVDPDAAAIEAAADELRDELRDDPADAPSSPRARERRRPRAANGA